MPNGQVLNKIKETIFNQFNSVETIIIWGGYLQPDFNEKFGDIDLLIFLKDEKRLNLKKIKKKIIFTTQLSKNIVLDIAVTIPNLLLKKEKQLTVRVFELFTQWIYIF